MGLMSKNECDHDRDVFARPGVLSDFGLLSDMAITNHPMPVGTRLFMRLSGTLLRPRR